jgi:hypothetical protein
MCPFIYAKKITAPKSKSEKMKIEDFFGRWQVFFINKTELPYRVSHNTWDYKNALGLGGKKE